MQGGLKNKENREHKLNMWRLTLSLLLLIVLNIVASVQVEAASSASFKFDPDPETGPSGTYASSVSFSLNDQLDSLGTYAANSSASYKLIDGVPALEVYPVVSEEEEEGGGGGGGHAGTGQTTGPVGPSAPTVSLGEGGSLSHPSTNQGGGVETQPEKPRQSHVTPTKQAQGIEITTCPLESISLDDGQENSLEAWASLNRIALRQYTYLLLIFVIILIIFASVHYHEQHQIKKHSKKIKRKHS